MASQSIAYPVPRNLNYMWTFGAILSFMLGAQIITGIVLAMHYTPESTLAFSSVEHIMRDVNYGWLIRYLHSNGASMFFFAVYMHIFRGIYYGSYREPPGWWIRRRCTCATPCCRRRRSCFCSGCRGARASQDRPY